MSTPELELELELELEEVDLVPVSAAPGVGPEVGPGGGDASDMYAPYSISAVLDSASQSNSNSPTESTESSSRQESSSSPSVTSISISNANANNANFNNANPNPNLNVGAGGPGTERRLGGLSQQSSSRDSTTAANSSTSTSSGGAYNGNSNGGGGGGVGVGGTGTKTPRKNVQWAASTKGEGPMNAAAEAHAHAYRHGYAGGREGYGYSVLTHTGPREGAGGSGSGNDRHVHLLDEEGLDPKAFQTLARALERHQSSSRDNSPSAPHAHAHPTVRRDFASSGSADHNMNQASNPGSGLGSISRSEMRARRSEPPRLSSLPPNPFSPHIPPHINTNMNNTNANTNANASAYHARDPNSNPFASNSFNEIFTPTTLSPIHSDAETETDEVTPERIVPGEAIIESTETHGLPQPLPASATNAPGTASESSAGKGGGGGGGGRFSFFPFRSGSKDDQGRDATAALPSSSTSGGGRKTGIGEGALGTFSALDAEEDEKRRVERRASKLVRAHARGFQFLAGFKGNKALQRMAPEDIDTEAPLPRKPTRFSRSTKKKSVSASASGRRRRPRSAPAPEEKKSRESSLDEDEDDAQDRERHGLFSFRRLSRSRSRSQSRSRSRRHTQDGDEAEAETETEKGEDEDIEASAAHKSTHHAPLPLGSGVLSALLTLYDRQAGGRSGFSTPTTTAGERTPSVGSEPTSPIPDSEDYFGRYAQGRREREKEKERERDRDREREKERSRNRDRGRDRDREKSAERQMDELQRINTRLNAGNMLDSQYEHYKQQERERFERERDRENKPSPPSDGRGEIGGGSSSASSSELTPPHPLYAQKSGARSLQSLRVREPFAQLTRTMSGGIERIKEKASPTRLTALPLPRPQLPRIPLPASIPFLGGDSLPAGARNGAGVFGSLIASTGNLTGVAAPVPSRIAPNPKKRGFHLNRYSWSEEREGEAGEEVEEALRRARRAAAAGGFRTPGSTSESLLALGMSKSAPTTPAGELPPASSVFAPGLGGLGALRGLGALGALGDTPSPASDASPASETPLMPMGASRNNLDAPSPALGPSGHSPSKSLDNAALLGERYPGHGRAQSDTLSLTTIPTRGSVATSTTLNNGGASTPGRRKWAGILKDFQRSSMMGENRSGAATPDTMSEAGSHDYWDEKHRRWVVPSTSAEEKRERKRKRKKAEIFITRHVAEIMQRQEFILKLARAFMMFGAPSHRLPAQIQATARVLDMELSCMYLPDVMLISFDDAATSTSNIKFIRQGAALSLGKLQDAYGLYWKVIHDEVGVGEASRKLDALMQQRPPYSTWQLAVFGGFCSAAICQVSFSGSFIDALIAFPMGMFLVFVQILSVRNELYSNVFEITITTLLSFMAAVFAGTHHFCYSAVASGSIVLILPGFLVLNGSLELSSRNIVSGAVRLCYAIMYALFLGFGLSIGGTLYEKFTGNPVASPEDYTCGNSHNESGAWYQRTPSGMWAFLTVPMFSLFLTLRNQAPWWKKELVVTVAISCIGWTCNHFSALKFPNRSDVSSAIGAFAVGFIANLYGRFFSGNAFVIMITGILFQLPSGLGNGGLITFASQNNTTGSSTSYLSGFRTALQLISVSVGLTVGLGISLVVIFPIQSRKRAGGIFSL